MKPREIKQVLAAVDFSDWTTPVLKAAAEMAEHYEAGLTVVYAEMLFPPAYCGEEALVTIRSVMDTELDRAKTHLAEEVYKAIGLKTPFNVRVLMGLADQGILDVANDIDAGLIVLGTHGRSGVSRLLMGSVAEKVVRQTKVPVLTVHPIEEDVVEQPHKIICPVNYSEAARESLMYAADIACRQDAELVVMHVLENEPENLSETVRKEEDRLCEWIPEEVRAKSRPELVIRHGEPAEQVLREAEGGCSLVVIGAQHKRLMESTIFGTTSVRVMRHANCPVFTVVRH